MEYIKGCLEWQLTQTWSLEILRIKETKKLTSNNYRTLDCRWVVISKRRVELLIYKLFAKCATKLRN